MRKLVAFGAAAALLVLLVLPAGASARITVNTVEPTAELAMQGHRAEVGVLLTCDAAQRALLHVTLTQDSQQHSTAALARGRDSVACSTDQARFAVTAKSRRGTTLVAGEATLCVLALTSDDARQWCKEITLE